LKVVVESGHGLSSGELIQILADWAEEAVPLCAFHPSRHLPPAKVRAFLEFALASIGEITNDRQRKRNDSE